MGTFINQGARGYNKLVGKIKTKIISFFNRTAGHLKKNKLLYLVFTPLLIAILTFGLLYYFLVLPKSYVTESSPTSANGANLNTDGSIGLDQADNQSDQSSGDGSSSNGSSPDNQPTPTPTPVSTPVVTPTPETPTVVAFYADSQSDTDEDSANHQRVVDYILGTSAYTVFHAGDLLEDGAPDSLNRFNNVTATLRATRNFYSAPGNNERNSSVYFDNFSYPGNEHWYSVNVGNLHMVILDNTSYSSIIVGSEQYNWLAADLQSAESQGKITGVIFHYPIYGAGDLASLFVSYNVDFVVSGHVHTYQKLLVNGVYYFTMSGQPSIGYMVAYVYSNRAEIYAYDASNAGIDSANISAR
jgi:predicted phosphodiesterase